MIILIAYVFNNKKDMLYLDQTKVLMGDVMKEATFSLAEVKFTAGDVGQYVLENVSTAQMKIRSRKDNVAGRILHNLLPL